jgi:hypothetical protein
MSLAPLLTPAILNPGEKAGKNWRVHVRTPAFTELPISENGFSKRGTDVLNTDLQFAQTSLGIGIHHAARLRRRHTDQPNGIATARRLASDARSTVPGQVCGPHRNITVRNGDVDNGIWLGSQRNGRNLACSAFVK